MLTVWRFLLSLDESFGGDADELFKVSVELALITETDIDGNLGKRKPSRKDQTLRTLDTPMDDILMRRQAGRLLEQPSKVKFAQLGNTGKISKRDVLIEVGVNIRFDRAQLPLR